MREIEFIQIMHAVVFNDTPCFAECLENGVVGCGDTPDEAIAHMKSLCALVGRIDKLRRLEKAHAYRKMDQQPTIEDPPLHSVLEMEAEAEEATSSGGNRVPPR